MPPTPTNLGIHNASGNLGRCKKKACCLSFRRKGRYVYPYTPPGLGIDVPGDASEIRTQNLLPAPAWPCPSTAEDWQLCYHCNKKLFLSFRRKCRYVYPDSQQPPSPPISHSLPHLTLLSSDADASSVPWGLKARLLTCLAWPSSVGAAPVSGVGAADAGSGRPSARDEAERGGCACGSSSSSLPSAWLITLNTRRTRSTRRLQCMRRGHSKIKASLHFLTTGILAHWT